MAMSVSYIFFRPEIRGACFVAMVSMVAEESWVVCRDESEMASVMILAC
jgi:hypothetical protein